MLSNKYYARLFVANMERSINNKYIKTYKNIKV